MTTLVTGCAGFIGFHVAKSLLEKGETVVGLDNLNDYYDVNLKKARLEILNNDKFIFKKINLEDRKEMEALFKEFKFDKVINLGAQAGVRYSIENPYTYIDSNVMGFMNTLEGCRHTKVSHLVYASTSSVYGANTKQPFSEHDSAEHQLAIYAASKKANELMAHSYAHLFCLPCTGLRFFTVYGPWGRPDMALFKFTKNILAGEPIDVFNNGKMVRDFTYIDDIVESIVRISDKPAESNPNWDSNNPDPATSNAPYAIYNIGNNKPVELEKYISVIEDILGKKATRNYLPMQDGDVPSTCADSSRLAKAIDFQPKTSVSTGIKRFIDWYLEYYS